MTVLLVLIAVAAALAAPEPDLLLRDVRVLTMVGETPGVLEASAVLVHDGVIQAVGDDALAAAPADARVVDGKGRTLLPGLIDMHVHLWNDAELAAYLLHGVTTVRNASGMPFHLDQARRIADGELLGPRLVTTGPILNSAGPNQQVNHQLVETPEQARAAVRWQHAQGFRHLKVYSNLRPEVYAAVLATAGELDMTVMGHTPEGVRGPGVPHQHPFQVPFLDVLDDGFVTIEHVESIVWHGLADDTDPARARTLARKIAAAGVAVTPTLVAHRNLLEVADSDGAYLHRPGVELLDPFVVELQQDTYQHWSAQPHGTRRDLDAFYALTTRILHEEGVRLVAGSDAGIFTNVPGASLHDEIRLLVDAGLSPHDALRAATADAADVLGLPTGRIAPGLAADLLLVDGDPLSEPAALARIVGLVVAGRWIDRQGLADLATTARSATLGTSRPRLLQGLESQTLPPPTPQGGQSP